MNDDEDHFAIMGTVGLGLMLAVVALVGSPDSEFSLVLVLLALLLPIASVVVAVSISRRRARARLGEHGRGDRSTAAARAAVQGMRLVRGPDRSGDEQGEALQPQALS